MTATRWIRIGLWFLAAIQLVTGGAALLAPRAFFSINVVSLFPPYNEHLFRDFGALNLALAVVLIFAAVRPDRRLVQAALAGYLVFTAIHFVFHAAHLGGFPVVLAVFQTIATAIEVVLPVLLLWPARRLHPDYRRTTSP